MNHKKIDASKKINEWSVLSNALFKVHKDPALSAADYELLLQLEPICEKMDNYYNNLRNSETRDSAQHDELEVTNTGANRTRRWDFASLTLVQEFGNKIPDDYPPNMPDLISLANQLGRGPEGVAYKIDSICNTKNKWASLFSKRIKKVD